MSIKPVAWMKNAKQGQHTSLIFTGFETEGFEPLIPAIPDTHRVVPIELLERILAECYLHPYDSENSIEICRIIDNK